MWCAPSPALAGEGWGGGSYLASHRGESPHPALRAGLPRKRERRSQSVARLVQADFITLQSRRNMYRGSLRQICRECGALPLPRLRGRVGVGALTSRRIVERAPTRRYAPASPASGRGVASLSRDRFKLTSSCAGIGETCAAASLHQIGREGGALPLPRLRGRVGAGALASRRIVERAPTRRYAPASPASGRGAASLSRDWFKLTSSRSRIGENFIMLQNRRAAFAKRAACRDGTTPRRPAPA